MQALVPLLWVLVLVLSGKTLLLLLASRQYLYGVRGLLCPREPARTPEVTAVIAVRDEAPVLPRLFEALAGLRFPPGKLEFLFVDHGSTDATPELIRAFGASMPIGTVRLLSLPRETGGSGKATPLNAALAAAPREVLVFYDADSLPEATSLEHLLAGFDEQPPPDICMGACLPRNQAESWLATAGFLEAVLYNQVFIPAYCRLFGQVFPSGRNFAVTKQALDAARGWNPGSVGEDYELGLRLLQVGRGRLHFDPRALAWELTPAELPTWFGQRVRWNRANLDCLVEHLKALGRPFSASTWLAALPHLPNHTLDMILLLVADLAFLCALSITPPAWTAVVPPLGLYYSVQAGTHLTALKRQGTVSPRTMLAALLMWPLYSHLMLLTQGFALGVKALRGPMRSRERTVKREG